MAIKAAKVEQGGSKMYRVRVRRAGPPPVNVDEYFHRKVDADQFIKDLEFKLSRRRNVTQNVVVKVDFKKAVDLYLSDTTAMVTKQRRPLKDSARKDRRVRLTFLTVHGLGDYKLKDLTPFTLDEAISKIAQERSWSLASRYRYETAMSRLFEYAIKQGWIGNNPIDDDEYERVNDDRRRKRTYTDHDWQQLLNAADEQADMLSLFLRLAWDTGARKSELLNLHWADITPSDEAGLGLILEIRNTKNNVDRYVYTSEAVVPFYDAHSQRYKTDLTDFVFPGRVVLVDGQHYIKSVHKIDEPFKQARKAAGLNHFDARYNERLTIHHIRHTWATRLGDKGASLAQLMAAGGWETQEMPMRYMKLQERQSAEAALLLLDQPQ